MRCYESSQLFTLICQQKDEQSSQQEVETQRRIAVLEAKRTHLLQSRGILEAKIQMLDERIAERAKREKEGEEVR